MRAIVAIAMILSALFAKAQVPVFIFPSEDGIYLRWQGTRNAELEGYKVYRKTTDGAEWVLLTPEPLSFVQSKAEGFALVGNEAEILYNLLGKNSGAITAAEVAAASEGEGGRIFEAMTVVNPAAARLLGELYLDETAVKGTSYDYRITTLVSGQESDWSTVSVGAPFSAKNVPVANEVEVTEGDARVSLAFEPNKNDLQSGDVVSWQVYRSDQNTGSYKRISFENPMPVSVNTGGGASEQTLSFADGYLENGKTYFYRVKLINAAGVEGGFSKTYSATPSENGTVVPLSNFDVTALGSRALVSWDSNVDEGQFQIYSSRDSDAEPFNKVTSGVVLEGKGQWLDTKYIPGTVRYYFMELNVPNGKVWRTDTLQLLSIERAAPQPPERVEAEILDSMRVMINWSEVKSRSIIGYDVERLTEADDRDGILVNLQTETGLSYVDTLPHKGRNSYYYRVVSKDASLNRSTPSHLAKVKFPDEKPPQAPIFWRMDRRGDSLLMEWHAVPDLDLNHYTLRQKTASGGWQPIDSVSQTRYVYLADSSGSYAFSIEAVDTSGNRSRRSQVLHQTIPSKPPPILAITLAEKRGKGLEIYWEQPDSVRIHHLILTRINPRKRRQFDVWEGLPSTVSYFDKYAHYGESWWFELRVFDAAWRELGKSTFVYEPPQNE